MKCDLTQKVSLLIDGELPHAEEREFERHLDACDDCRSAHEDFLLLRRQLTDYPLSLDAFARQRALRRILNASAGAQRRLNETDAPRRRAGFAGVFGMPQLNPAGLAALLLLLFGVVAGIYFLSNARRANVDVASNPPAPVVNSNNASPVVNSNDAPPAATVATMPAPSDSTASANNTDDRRIAENRQKDTRVEAAGGVRPGMNSRRAESASVRVAQPSALSSSRRIRRGSVDAPVAESARNDVETTSGAGVDAANDAGADTVARREVEETASVNEETASVNTAGASKTARHVEQAQLLLRSFRNTRAGATGRSASSDLAYDKARSKKLLYENIVLRREAASRGNLPVESLLDSLEPILIDIANLPDRPAPEKLREINERMRRKNLVAMLQISAVETASARAY